jgi:hypothetical protein
LALDREADIAGAGTVLEFWTMNDAEAEVWRRKRRGRAEGNAVIRRRRALGRKCDILRPCLD